MADPRVPIDVDPSTGIWTTDGLPMIYMPRHFFMNYYCAMDAALGREQHRAMLYAASHKSAVQWAAAEAGTHGLRDVAVFQHYLSRLSQRGWAQLTLLSVELDGPAGPSAEVRADHSAFALSSFRTTRSSSALGGVFR